VRCSIQLNYVPISFLSVVSIPIRFARFLIAFPDTPNRFPSVVYGTFSSHIKLVNSLFDISNFRLFSLSHDKQNVDSFFRIKISY
jgi:hypothetical protein